LDYRVDGSDVVVQGQHP